MGGNFTIYLPILGFLLKFAGEELRRPEGAPDAPKSIYVIQTQRVASPSAMRPERHYIFFVV